MNLIDIGCHIPFDIEVFLHQLNGMDLLKLPIKIKMI